MADFHIERGDTSVGNGWDTGPNRTFNVLSMNAWLSGERVDAFVAPRCDNNLMYLPQGNKLAVVPLPSVSGRTLRV